MNEIKCPKCGEIFQADENYYAEIVKQVKDKELSSKEAEINKLKSEIKSEQISKKSEINEIISKKDKEVTELKNKLNSFNKDKDLEIANIVTDMSNKLSAQENFILKITNESELAEKEHKLREQSLKDKNIKF